MTTTSSVAGSLASALGVSSGIDTSSLVADLVAAARQPRQQTISSQQSTNNSRISALASAKSALSTFSNALTELLKSKDYSGQPASSNATIASVSLVSGATATPKGLPAQLVVNQLAAAQVLQSAAISGADGTANAGTGTLTFTTGSGASAKSFSVTLATGASTLNDLASAINGKNGGITATVVTDNSGARLVLKGATGADNAFTVTAGPDADADLSRFTFDGTSGTLTKSQSAANAQISLDNVAMEFATNETTTAIANLRIDFNSAAPGTKVTLATNQPTSTMADLVGEFVQNYNTLKSALNNATQSSADTVGLLASDRSVRDMANRLSQLTSTPLASTGTYRTLADLGVSTNKDGTLTLDSTRLNKALEADPAGVTQMLNPTSQTADNPGIGGALKSITDYLNAADGPLAASQKIYDNLKTQLAAQQTRLDTQMSNYSDQLSKTYSAMQTQLLQLKSTQTYLTNQIAAWNNKN